MFLWIAAGFSELPSETLEQLRDPGTVVYFSAVSAWEISIKQTLGKLQAPDDVADEVRRLRFVELPITVAHAVAVRSLPLLHADPFDRLLVAQAKVERLHLVTRDEAIKQYGVATLPA